MSASTWGQDRWEDRIIKLDLMLRCRNRRVIGLTTGDPSAILTVEHEAVNETLLLDGSDFLYAGEASSSMHFPCPFHSRGHVLTASLLRRELDQSRLSAKRPSSVDIARVSWSPGHA